MNIILVAEESAGTQTLKVLQQSPHHIVAVLASEHQEGATVWSAATKMGITVWPVNLVKDPRFAEQVRDADVDLLLNVHSLYLIDEKVVDAPKLGSYNLHPGPLPQYAGLNTVSWAIYRGETNYGVTLHRMEAGIDTGPIAVQQFFQIDENETALSVYTKCIRAGVELIREFLAAVERVPEAIPAIAQDFSRREYFNKRAPDGCRIHWSETARQISNLVRACDYFPFPSPWGHPRTGYEDREINIIKVRLTGRPCDVQPGTVGRQGDSSVEIACGDEWLLCEYAMVDGKSVAAATLLQSGKRLQDGAESSRQDPSG